MEASPSVDTPSRYPSPVAQPMLSWADRKRIIRELPREAEGLLPREGLRRALRQ